MTRRRIIAMDTGGLDRRIELIKVILEKADTCDTMNLCFIKNYDGKLFFGNILTKILFNFYLVV